MSSMHSHLEQVLQLCRNIGQITKSRHHGLQKVQDRWAYNSAFWTSLPWQMCGKVCHQHWSRLVLCHDVICRQRQLQWDLHTGRTYERGSTPHLVDLGNDNTDGQCCDHCASNSLSNDVLCPAHTEACHAAACTASSRSSAPMTAGCTTIACFAALFKQRCDTNPSGSRIVTATAAVCASL